MTANKSKTAQSSGLNGKVLSPLIDFDFIVNTDVGLIRLIKIRYQDERAFDLDILNKSDREILSLLYSRRVKNPLSVISTEENMKDIDDLYKSFFDKYKQDIIDLSTVSKHTDNFIHMIAVNGNNFGISPSIAVRDEMEKNEIIKHYGNSFTFVDRLDKSTIRAKDPFYVKDYTIFTDAGLSSMSRKKIYMLPLQYSIDYFEETSNNLTSRNVFMLMGKDYRNNKGDSNNEHQ